MDNVITLKDSSLTAAIKMAEGNPGALIAIMRLLNDTEDGILALLHLDEMGIRGYKIWVGYNDYCNNNLEKFYNCCLNREEKMRKFIEDFK